MLAQRVISAIVFVPLVLAAVYLGGLSFLTLLVLVAAVATGELYTMAIKAGRHPFWPLGMALVVAIVLDAKRKGGLEPLVTPLLIISLLWLLLRRDSNTETVLDWALTLAGALYVGWLARYGVLLRDLTQGLWWVGLMLLATWASDVAAYFVGRYLGRRLLLPRVSPNKTWEGTIVGVLAPTLITLAFVPILSLPLGQAILLGPALGIGAVCGDLVESAIKRGFGATQASGLIPGHGGVLDRIDSILFTMVIVYWYAVGIYGAT